MNEDKEVKGKRFDIKDLYNNKQYRALLILGFYVILFVIIIASIRSNSNNVRPSNNDNPAEEEQGVLEGYELISSNNFAYRYTISLDDRIIMYNGKKHGTKEEFMVSDGENERSYYINDDDIFIKNGDTYTKSVKPYFVFDFFDTSIIESIIKGATNDGENLIIGNQSIYNLVGEYNNSIADGTNVITLSYRNSNITKISFDLSSYSKAMGESYNSVIITLEYYDFNLIDEING